MRVDGWSIVRGTFEDAWTPVLADMEAALSGPATVRLREGNTRVTAHVPGTGAVWKWWRRTGSREVLRALWGPSEAAREFDRAARAAGRGVPTAEPLFAAERRVLGLLRGQALAFRYLPDAVGLDRSLDLLHAGEPDALTPVERQRVLRLAARTIAAMHQAGILHGDLRLDNLILQPGPDGPGLSVLDWNRATFLSSPCEKEGLADLCLLAANLIMFGGSGAEMGDLLHAYCRSVGWTPRQERSVRREVIRGVRRRIRRYVERMVRNALRPGRRQAACKSGGFVAACEVGVPLERLEATVNAQAGLSLPARRGARPLERAHVVADPHAEDVWRAARVARTCRLPCRRVLGVVAGGRAGAGWVVMEPASGRSLREDLLSAGSRAGALGDLRALMRLIHAFGLRLRSCVDGDMGRVSTTGGVARRSNGVIVANPCTLRVAPESDKRASWSVLRDWVASVCGGEAADALMPRVPAGRRAQPKNPFTLSAT